MTKHNIQSTQNEPSEEVFYDSTEMEAPEIDQNLDDQDNRPEPVAGSSYRKIIPEKPPLEDLSSLPPTVGRTKALGILGITPQSFDVSLQGKLQTSSRKANHRATHIAFLQEIAPAIIADHNGTVMFRAKTILNEMQKRGGGLTADGRLISGANFCGDFCGHHGLHLPVCVRNGVRFFMISMVEKSEDEKLAAQALLNGLSKKEFAALPLA